MKYLEETTTHAITCLNLRDDAVYKNEPYLYKVRVIIPNSRSSTISPHDT